MDPGNDDYRELSSLLFGARERYRSVRATVRHRRRGELATEAINRYVEYGFRHGILSNFDPPYDVPTYREYGDLERSEEHTSELQSHSDLVCRLLLEKKKQKQKKKKKKKKRKKKKGKEKKKEKK